ncbi:hypothetical protein [Corynebacterium heidelbergense]|uniref:Alkaline shock response membrane anchor protein AmaP n=1 Tax=Corynebacterium heidelbergense TaxID=2055947 RepID=A0A364V8C6_9CORY|nr:hypothetical protein [Corynebacterium heidelbergense]RAV32816.1 hypothetical protein DLJ54_01550 [Corynebacterium heidelbergense]RAV34440.1 hypothetical protein CWC39_03250 [Corynebacterium heidelbergense]WCZ37543.1 hypothetical protein CHEID_10105 [Corynebacterium heidelbergense]
MSRTTSFFNRLIAFLLFAVLAFLAAWGIGKFFHQAFADKISSSVDQKAVSGLPNQSNYIWWLVGAAAIALILGLIFLIMNLQRRRVGRQISPASNREGTIALSPADIAHVVEYSFAHLDGVRTSHHKCINDRGTRVVNVTVHAPAKVDMEALSQACTEAAEDVRQALPGQEIYPRFMVELDRVE